MSAHALGQIYFPSGTGDRDDLPRASNYGEARMEQTGRALSEYDDRIRFGNTGAQLSVPYGRESFNQGRFGQRQVGWKRMNVASGNTNILTEGTFKLASNDSGIAAKMLIAAQATIALAATHHGIDDHALTFLQLNAGADGRDRSSRFMSKNDRVAQSGVVAQEHAEVAVAHRRSGYSDHHFISFGGRNWPIQKRKLSRLLQNC